MEFAISGRVETGDWEEALRLKAVRLLVEGDTYLTLRPFTFSLSTALIRSISVISGKDCS